MKRLVLLLALLSCASAPYRPFRAPWQGAAEYHELLMCAARHQYGHEAAETFRNTVEVVVVQDLVYLGLTHNTQIRIRGSLSKVKREAVLRHESVHWFQHYRTDEWTYYPACSAKSEHPDKDFIQAEYEFNAAFNGCSKEASGTR